MFQDIHIYSLLHCAVARCIHVQFSPLFYRHTTMLLPLKLSPRPAPSIETNGPSWSMVIDKPPLLDIYSTLQDKERKTVLLIICDFLIIFIHRDVKDDVIIKF